MYFAECNDFMLNVQYIRSVKLQTMLTEDNKTVDVCIVTTHDGQSEQIVGEDAVVFFNSAKSQIAEWKVGGHNG